MADERATVFVSGCFDLLHSGHITFLESAAALGQLSVSVGSDATILGLKRRLPICREDERLYHVRALRCVHQAFIARGSGALDFEAELRERRPTMFVVNEDGDTPAKRRLCEELGVGYRVLSRQPESGLPARSTSDLQRQVRLPYRIDLAGGWLDQPVVSRLAAGPVIVVSLEPPAGGEYELRSGLATSTRATAARLWGARLPTGDAVELGRQLFACENPPGRQHISGSQDALGIVLPGVSRLGYRGEFWPDAIDRITGEETLSWLDSVLHLKWLGSRSEEFNPLRDVNSEASAAERLAAAAEDCWKAIGRRDAGQLGRSLTQSFRAACELFPDTTNGNVEKSLAALPPSVLGAKLAGAGGSGYLVLCSEQRPAGTEPVAVRRPDSATLQYRIRSESK